MSLRRYRGKGSLLYISNTLGLRHLRCILLTALLGSVVVLFTINLACLASILSIRTILKLTALEGIGRLLFCKPLIFCGLITSGFFVLTLMSLTHINEFAILRLSLDEGSRKMPPC
ncbi:hypothetical protein EDB80DRAFT_731928 [Ilyonectria destructans]|nr:hypothetical protein EDB80DRAFT_731928 [Ilyonectria destructans]